MAGTKGKSILDMVWSFARNNWLVIGVIGIVVVVMWGDGVVERFTKGEHVMMELYYHPQCGHCKTFLPIWMQWKDGMVGTERLTITEHNCSEEACNDPLVKGYPTVIRREGESNIMFKGDRTIDGLSNFFMKGREQSLNLINDAL